MQQTRILRMLSGVTLCALAAAVCLPAQGAPDATARCAELMHVRAGVWPDSSTVIVAATMVTSPAANAPTAGAPGAPLPAHCELFGKLRERVGVGGQRYAIQFHARLPIDWNGRFLFQGGGGSDGAIGDAVGTIGPAFPSALARGFAVLSQDSGHDNRTNNDPTHQGTLAFGYDPQARRDHAYASLDVTARTGQALVRAFYGRPPERSYFFGCSEGGREGMVFAQRFPELFDGIVAAAPGFALPKAAIAEAWDTHAFVDLARQMALVDSAGTPRIGETFADADFALVSDAVLASCDAKDGVVDGIVGDYTWCDAARVRSALDALACAGPKVGSCLTTDQIATLRRVMGGPRNSKGELLYSDWPWDAGIGGRLADGRYQQGWRIWKIGIVGARPIPALNVILGAPSLSALFTTPPTPLANDPRVLLRYAVDFDLDRDAPRIFARAGDFTESSWELVGAQRTDLSAFQRRGGKLIVPHGLSDPVFSAHDTMRWWDAVNSAAKGHAADFVRVFPVPGMAHCSGGPATDQYDCLTSIVDWVERGIAPESIPARAGAMSPWPGRSRPLCPYPLVARYDGGDVEAAVSFACRP